jgi:hypothetical protein
MTQDTVTISPGSRFRAAMILAIIADALQIVVFPVFVEGALSPADDGVPRFSFLKLRRLRRFFVTNNTFAIIRHFATSTFSRVLPFAAHFHPAPPLVKMQGSAFSTQKGRGRQCDRRPRILASMVKRQTP